MNFLHNVYDNRQQVDSIYLDKTFDTVSHAKLLSKLWDAGIIDNLWSFFKAYLSNRQQCVVVANNKSNWYSALQVGCQKKIDRVYLVVLYHITYHN